MRMSQAEYNSTIPGIRARAQSRRGTALALACRMLQPCRKRARKSSASASENETMGPVAVGNFKRRAPNSRAKTRPGMDRVTPATREYTEPTATVRQRRPGGFGVARSTACRPPSTYSPASGRRSRYRRQNTLAETPVPLRQRPPRRPNNGDLEVPTPGKDSPVRAPALPGEGIPTAAAFGATKKRTVGWTVRFIGTKNGSGAWIRTRDQVVNSHLLYR